MKAKLVTIAEIAAALQVTDRAARDRAVNAGWLYTEKSVRGGRQRLYSISDLPRDVRTALSRHQIAAVQAELTAKGVLKDKAPAPAPAPAALVAAEKISATPKAEQRRDGRLELYHAYVDYRLAAGASDRQAMPSFATLWVHAASAIKAGQPLPAALPEAISKQPRWVFEAQPRLSVATLRRIAEAVKKGEIGALAGRYGGRADTGIIDRAYDGRAVEIVLALLSKSDHLSAYEVRRQLRGNLGEDAVMPDGQVVPWPSVRRFQAWIAEAKVKFADVLMALKNPDGWRSRYEFAFGEQPVGEGLNDRWQIDASPADAL
ncbi:hypothetical protein, partial [Zavarzinia aquatilis]